MLHIDRRKEILNIIMSKGSVKVANLSQKYGVGEATIRRDLKYLAEEYGITLSYGGAFRKEKLNYQTTSEMDIYKKRTQNTEEKRFIAEKAAKLNKTCPKINALKLRLKKLCKNMILLHPYRCNTVLNYL